MKNQKVFYKGKLCGFDFKTYDPFVQTMEIFINNYSQ